MDERLQNAVDELKKRTETICSVIKKRSRTTTDRIDAYAKSAIDRLSVKERLVIIFAIGIALGFAVKHSASQNVTIGYDDYTVKNQGKAYDLIAMQKKLAEKALSGESTAAQAPQGGVCQ
ncbi:MAG: hypothetical protein WCL23_05130 [Candidatus Moraniibacteriota bacterium]